MAACYKEMQELTTVVNATEKAKNMDVLQRVEMSCALINNVIQAWYEGAIKDGEEIFQEKLCEFLKSVLLMESRWVPLAAIIVFPGNREGAGLIPVDVHDLLRLFTVKGFSWLKLVGAQAGEIPPSMRAAWIEFNKKLVERSHGLLAPVHETQAEVATTRGSHTSAGARCMEFGSKGFHEELCVDGRISKAEIVEAQPSLAEPGKKGMLLDVIRWQIIEACPQLMQVLSRTGNADHEVARIQTALQQCKRMHSLSKMYPDDEERTLDAACIGKPAEYKEEAKLILKFTDQQAGGPEGLVLEELEQYEQTLEIKRKISAEVLGSLAPINIPGCRRIVCAMYKAMLCSPDGYESSGFSTLLSPSDVSTVMPGGKNVKSAKECNELMQDYRDFLQAYSRLPETEITITASDLDVDCIMKLFKKRSDTRSTFSNLFQVAQKAYDQAQSMHKDLALPPLPAWRYLDPVKESKGHPKRNQVAECKCSPCLATS